MKKRYYLLFGAAASVALAFSGFKATFNIPKSPQLMTVGENSAGQPLICFQQQDAKALDNNGELKLLVWNIYKQGRDNWSQELTRLSSDAQLLLMQEASMDSGLKAWISEHGWGGNQVNAFQVMGKSAGVINLARTMPNLACGYTEMEPWLRLPKSGIYAQYPLSNGHSLAVVNVHAVNFTYGTNEYKLQLESLATKIQEHTGPVIVAGDFNSWSDERVNVIKKVLFSLGLQEAIFNPDHRIRFMTGLPLDHVFYKDLTLKNAKAPESDASDHNPLILNFSL